jgi:hypothetical protein
MPKIGELPQEQPSYPAQLLYCNTCSLVQLGLAVDPRILFPPEYPYTSSTTKILRENFSELYKECSSFISLKKDDLVIDIGSNDGNLLSNFKDHHRVLGVTPEEMGKVAISRGIPTIIDFFTKKTASLILREHGKAAIVTATNVFAHIDNINEIVKDILSILHDEGVFISESHYLLPLVKDMQYDTIYHEHLRYYSLHSLIFLFQQHGMEIFHAKKIPTHGGSIRIYAARKGKYAIKSTVDELLNEERKNLDKKSLLDFGKKIALSKLELYSLICTIRKEGKVIFGISAPSRASTLINYVGLKEDIIDCVVEVEGSHKIGKYMPGTLIPVLNESALFERKPDYALILSWHIAEELMPKLRHKGFKGKFIIPLPHPKIVS